MVGVNVEIHLLCHGNYVQGIRLKAPVRPKGSSGLAVVEAAEQVAVLLRHPSHNILAQNLRWMRLPALRDPHPPVELREERAPDRQ